MHAADFLPPDRHPPVCGHARVWAQRREREPTLRIYPAHTLTCDGAARLDCSTGTCPGDDAARAEGNPLCKIHT